ncbi:hypothetical protein ACF0H5_006286 [Mactra antiquata]
MGKNKPKSLSKKQKKEKAFVVSNIKKAKTKSVSTNLKKMNVKTKASIDKADEKFKDLQEVIADTTKTQSKSKSTKREVDKAIKATTSNEVDMDSAAESFSKL